jgi:hypothetical protein
MSYIAMWICLIKELKKLSVELFVRLKNAASVNILIRNKDTAAGTQI